MTLYHRITDGTRHELTEAQYTALAENKRVQLRRYIVDARPTPAPEQTVIDAGLVITELDARQTWALRALTPEELRVVVSPRQIRQALNAAGLRAQVEAAVAAGDQDTRDWWEFATSFESDHPVLAAMAAGMGLSEAQVRDVFTLAQGL